MDYFKIDYYKELKRENKIFEDIIKSYEFQRLKKISFLGLMERIYKFKDFNRYDHSLGVAYLALKFFELHQIKNEESLYFIVACLLHDLGHPPFSHLSERALNINHKTRTYLMIRNGGNGKTGKENNVNKILKEFGIKSSRIIKILKGQDTNKLFNELINNPFNLDTIDAINRCAFVLNLKPLNPFKIISSYQVSPNDISINKKKVKLLDQFWKLKETVYKNYIYNGKNIKLEASFGFLLKKHLDQKYLENSENDYLEMKDDDLINFLYSEINGDLKSILNNVLNSKFIDELNVVNIYAKINESIVGGYIDAIYSKLKKNFPDLQVYDKRVVRTFFINNTIDFYIPNIKNKIEWVYNRYKFKNYYVFVCLLTESIKNRRIFFYLPELSINNDLERKYFDLNKFI